MTVKSKLHITTFILIILLSALIGLLLFFSTLQNRQLLLANQARYFAQDIAELGILTGEYMTYGETRMRGQWQAKREKIALLAKDIPVLNVYKTFRLSFLSLDKAIQFHEKNQKQYALQQNLTSAQQTRYRLLQQQTADRIRIDIQKLIALSFDVSDTAQVQAAQLKQQSNLILFATISAIILIIAVSGFLVTRNITRSLDFLVSTARATYSNSHHATIATSDNDEISMVSMTINKMMLTIVEQKLALTESNKNLEQMIAERTHALEIANKELESFSYSVSHDLRAPLRSIKGFSQILQEDYQRQLDKVGQDYLQRISNGVDRMDALTQDLLKLSEITCATIQKENVCLSELVKNSWDRLNEDDAELKLEVHIRQDVYAHADKNLMSIVFDNLLSNALKYSSKKDKAIIEFGSEENAEELSYFIKDNGCGFDMEYADKLFGAFQRLHKASEFPGTGVGLATVARIVHRHGGHIWAEAEEGEGAVFYFTLGGVTEDA